VGLTRTVGWFTSLFPLRLSADLSADPRTRLLTVKRELTSLPHHGLSYAVLRYLASDQKVRQVLQPIRSLEVSFNYLGQLDAAQTGLGFLRLTNAPAGALVGPDNPRYVSLDINCFVTGGQCHVDWSYSRDQYNAKTVQALAERFNAHLAALVEHCCAHI